MTSTWGDFVIVEEIGRGGFGAVFKAYHPTLRQHVALKLIPVAPRDDREIEKALDEPRRLASVHHHNVVTVHDARYADGHVGICMELIAGESLAQIVERHGRLGPDEVTPCAITLCKALSAIHHARIVHNDVKAQNVMREDGGRIVLMDFGAGRRLFEPDRTTGLYLTGTAVYMAPELFEFRDPTPASDIYGLGVLMFFLLTGAFPVEGASLHEVAENHTRKDRRRYLGDLRNDIPGRLLAVVDRALAPSPLDRYQTCGEMLHDLTADEPLRLREGDDPWRQGEQLLRQVHNEPPPHPEPRPSREWLWTGAAALVATIPAIWVIGFLASRAHSVMFGLHGQFDAPSPLSWLVVGFRTLPLPLTFVVVAEVLYVAVTFGWRVATRVSSRVSQWSSTLSTRVASAAGTAGLDEPNIAGALVLLVQAGCLGVVYWAFGDLIKAITTPLDEGPIAAHAQLAQGNMADLFFCAVTAVLAFAGTVTWTRIARRRQPNDGWAAIVAGFALTIVFAGMATVPWQVEYGSKFRVAFFESERCYVVNGELPDVALLLCPWRAGGRSVETRKDNPKLQWRDEVENVFFAVAARLRADGGT